MGASFVFLILKRIGNELNMAQPHEKVERTNRSESDSAAKYLSDRTNEQLLSTATELCLLYLQYEKFLKKQEAGLGDGRGDA